LPSSLEGATKITFRDWSNDQNYLFPSSPDGWLRQDDIVYSLLDTVATLDLSPNFALTSVNSAVSRRSILG
jgi:hypothetical protein